MGDIHIRNLWCSNEDGANSTIPERVLLWLSREAFLVGRWTVVDIDSATGWDSASNILLPLTDFAVTAAAPYKITSPTGGFDAATHEGRMITLFASNDNIRGIYNVSAVENSNTLYVDARTRAGAWPVDESGITGRIHKAAIGDPLTSTGSYVVMQAPAASGSVLQLHFSTDSANRLNAKALPLGDWLTSANETVTRWADADTYDDYVRMNWYFSDAASPVLMYYYHYTSAFGWRSLNAGELLDTLPGDTNPGFLNGTYAYHLDDNGEMRMLNELNAQTNFWPSYYKYWESDDETTKREQHENAIRINDGKHKVFRPLVVGEDTANGGFIRGVDPRAYCHESLTSIDEVGTDWWHLGSSVLVPRDGVDDPRPLATDAI